MHVFIGLALIFPTLVRFSGEDVAGFGFLWLAPVWAALFLIVILQLMSGRSVRYRAGPRQFLAVGHVLILTIAAFVWFSRAGEERSMSRLIILLSALSFALALALTPFHGRSRAHLIRSALLSLPLFLGLNLLLMPFFGSDSGHGRALMAQALGLDVGRTLLPFASGINNIGGVGSAAAAAGFILFLYGRTWFPRGVGAITLLLGAGVILLTDNRGGLVFAAIAVLAIAAGKLVRRPRIALGTAALSILIIPLVLSGFVVIAVEDSAVSALGRSETDIGTLNNRLYIWEAALRHVASSPQGFLFGNGLDGHAATGFAEEISYIFPPDDPNRAEHTAHNGLLQAALDTGVIGAVLLTLVTLAAASSFLAKRREPASLACGAALLTFFLLATTEAHLMPEVADSYPFVLLLLAVGVTAGAPGTPRRGQATARGPLA